MMCIFISWWTHRATVKKKETRREKNTSTTTTKTNETMAENNKKKTMRKMFENGKKTVKPSWHWTLESRETLFNEFLTDYFSFFFLFFFFLSFAFFTFLTFFCNDCTYLCVNFSFFVCYLFFVHSGAIVMVARSLLLIFCDVEIYLGIHT